MTNLISIRTSVGTIPKNLPHHWMIQHASDKERRIPEWSSSDSTNLRHMAWQLFLAAETNRVAKPCALSCISSNPSGWSSAFPLIASVLMLAPGPYTMSCEGCPNSFGMMLDTGMRLPQ